MIKEKKNIDIWFNSIPYNMAAVWTSSYINKNIYSLKLLFFSCTVIARLFL